MEQKCNWKKNIVGLWVTYNYAALGSLTTMNYIGSTPGSSPVVQDQVYYHPFTFHYNKIPFTKYLLKPCISLQLLKFTSSSRSKVPIWKRFHDIITLMRALVSNLIVGTKEKKTLWLFGGTGLKVFYNEEYVFRYSLLKQKLVSIIF